MVADDARNAEAAADAADREDTVLAGSYSGELWPDASPDAARRLMWAGVESFARRGYHATTTRDIARAAGMSPAALYVHFPSKAALLYAISKSGHERTLTLVERIHAQHRPPAQRLRTLVHELVAWHAREHTVARVIEYELDALPENEYRTVFELRGRIERHVHELIRSGARTGDFTVSEAKTAARAVLSLSVDVARWYTDRVSKTPEQIGTEYAELVLRMLGVQTG